LSLLLMDLKIIRSLAWGLDINIQISEGSEDLSEMTESHSFISATLAELSRRKVLRTVGAYAVAVFVVLQLMDAAVEPLRLPEWLPTLVVIVVILGFPLVFLLAWHLEVTPTGVHRTTTAGLMSRSQSAFLFSFMLLAMVGLAYGFYEYYSGVFDSPAAIEVAKQREFRAPENSIAVLPFADLSASGDQAHFSDGIAEEILNLLARVEGLHVAARTSSFAFRNPGTDIREIGRLLNVSTVLEGSLRTAGNRIRLTAQLINVEDGYHIWSQSYDRELDDIFGIQDEVAHNIATALVDSFAGLSTRPQGRTDSLAASQAYRTGRLHWWRRTSSELQRAIELFAKALEHDAQFAPAYAGLADTWLLLSAYGNISVLKAAKRAHPMIEKALEIDPESEEAFAALGLARKQIGQLDAAESALRQAVELNEDYIPAQLWLAVVLKELGRYPEEHMVLQKAMRLDPLNELLAINYANNLAVRGDWVSGKELMQSLVDLRPDSTMLLRFMAGHEIEHGNLAQGWKLANRAWQLEPDNPEDISSMAKTWIMLGELEEAERLILRGLELADQNANLLTSYWQMLIVAGRFEEAHLLVRDVMAMYGEGMPAALKRKFDLQLGMIALLQENYPLAYELLSMAISEEDKPAYSGEEILIVTMAALASQRIGNDEESEERLAAAERKVQRARLNGVDDPGIYYTEAVLLAMQNDPEQALLKLNQAYERGWRDRWMLNIDYRLKSLHGQEEFIVLQNRLDDDINQALAEIRSVPVAAL
jgi:TolB-like protein/Flp pilus assembly protein TadD